MGLLCDPACDLQSLCFIFHWLLFPDDLRSPRQDSEETSSRVKRYLALMHKLQLLQQYSSSSSERVQSFRWLEKAKLLCEARVSGCRIADLFDIMMRPPQEDSLPVTTEITIPTAPPLQEGKNEYICCGSCEEPGTYTFCGVNLAAKDSYFLGTFDTEKEEQFLSLSRSQHPMDMSLPSNTGSQSLLCPTRLPTLEAPSRAADANTKNISYERAYIPEILYLENKEILREKFLRFQKHMLEEMNLDDNATLPLCLAFGTEKQLAKKWYCSLEIATTEIDLIENAWREYAKCNPCWLTVMASLGRFFFSVRYSSADWTAVPTAGRFNQELFDVFVKSTQPIDKAEPEIGKLKKDLRSQEESWRSQVAALNAAQQTQQDMLDTHKRKIKLLKTTLSARLDDVTQDNSRLKEKLASLGSKVQYASEKLESLGSEVQDAREKLESLSSEVQYAGDANHKLSLELIPVRSDVEYLKGSRNLEFLEDNLRSRLSTLDLNMKTDLGTLDFNMKTKLRTLASKMDNLNSDVKLLEGNLKYVRAVCWIGLMCVCALLLFVTVCPPELDPLSPFPCLIALVLFTSTLIFQI
ncbi:hypothetical protein Pelo_13477 [Pelomyxa schiedti]|nr:hypothetical protein Pelo_13477 [Pelomyxa schiedti]